MADEFFAGEVQAVDVHGHYGGYDQDKISELQREFLSANAEEVIRRARHARVDVLPQRPRRVRADARREPRHVRRRLREVPRGDLL